MMTYLVSELHLTKEELDAALPAALTSPADRGTVDLLVVRRDTDHREVRQEVYAHPDLGLEGDRWRDRAGRKPDPRSQLTLMNTRVLRLLARTEDRMPLAGDQLVVDLDLSAANLPVGQRLRVGDAVLEVTDLPHRGCAKFAQRFGKPALKYISHPERRDQHLRGLYVRVVEPGLLRAGMPIEKV